MTVGASVTVDRDGRTIACAIFRPARFLFSSDVEIRRGLLELCDERGLDLPFYRELTRPLRVEQPTRHRWHGLLAWTITPTGDPTITVGLVPPDEPTDHRPRGARS